MGGYYLSDLPFKIGDAVRVVSWLFGDVDVQAVSGVTVAKRTGTTSKVATNGVAELVYVSTNYWVLGGNLETS